MTEDSNNNGGFEAFLKKKEKNLLKSMFATSDDEDSCPSSSTSSPSRSRSNSQSDEDDDNDNSNTIFQFSKLSCADESQPSIESNILIYQNKLAPELQIHIQERKQLGIAHQLWPAAGYLTEYFLEHLDQILPIVNPSIKEDPSSLPLTVNCIELGAGLGLTGIFLSKYFQSHSQLNISQMVLTDLPEALEGLNQNIQLNPTITTNSDFPIPSIPSISAMELSWGKDTKQIDHIFQSFSNISIPTIIIAADVIYWECLFLPLIESISYLCHTYQCKIFIAHIKRWKKDQKFLLLAKKHKLLVNILQENITMEIHEHTKQLEKQIKRIYCISAMK